ncbi:hypothetical protein [Labrys wisconsinensis]|uniref:Uncharacterized protein n=1 Tax=Labrys wisconsinensis TaxID=425677 RepID=A0ABU0J205_9HYPH|nr:hypothetical protein [Labrys wisconsinensis]MDQ0468293.1 hypothetical protein [Labrys wisconsinensis]
MQTTHETKPATRPARPLFRSPEPKIPRRDSDPRWRPEPCPLSREELRRIVIEQLG